MVASVAAPDLDLVGLALHGPRSAVDKVVKGSRLRARLLASGVTEDELKKIDGGVRSIVSEAAEFATQDPEPDPSELYTDILL